MRNNSKLKFKTPPDIKTHRKIKKRQTTWTKFMQSRDRNKYKEYTKLQNQEKNLTKKARN